MKVCIIGGGTSGWWTAGWLRKEHPDLEITLIESPNIPSIGVGESTMPHVKHFFDDLGIAEEEWMPSCSAVRKRGNVKRNWNGKGDEALNFKFWYEGFDEWLKLYTAGKVSKQSINGLYSAEDWQSYAFHMDAAQAWQIVKHYTNDVEHILAEVTEDTLPEADLYVDCTGLSRVFVKDKTLKTYPDTLVDTCIVRRLDEDPKDYSETIARDYGWEFNVYLSDNRVGCGYVFSSKYLSVEDAKKEYMANNGHRDFLSDFRVIKWEPGRLQNPWSGNTVAVGLSTGFVDPLEANGLTILVYQIRALSRFLKNPNGPKLYNRAVGKTWDQVVDFVWHHYALTERNDTEFWKYYAKLDGMTTLKERVKRNTNYSDVYVPSVYATLAVYYDKAKELDV